jgi:hypothetical protein
MPLDERQAMGAAGRQKVEACYDWHQIGEQLESVYQCVVAQATDRPVARRADQRSAGLPLEVRAALDLVAVHCGALEGAIYGRVVGQPKLSAELGRYAPVCEEGASQVISLGLDSLELRSVVATSAPKEIVTVTAGPLARILQPLRSKTESTTPIASPDVKNSTWRELGYERIDQHGVQGFGSVGWAAAERAMRRLNRPDLADRCRVAMLRCLIAARPFALGTVRVRHYREVRR